jgi:hypothetical protein
VNGLKNVPVLDAEIQTEFRRFRSERFPEGLPIYLDRDLHLVNHGVAQRVVPASESRSKIGDINAKTGHNISDAGY